MNWHNTATSEIVVYNNVWIKQVVNLHVFDFSFHIIVFPHRHDKHDDPVER